jgi:hypothetical protein
MGQGQGGEPVCSTFPFVCSFLLALDGDDGGKSSIVLPVDSWIGASYGGLDGGIF